MNAAKIGLAVQNGLSIVCATCQRYWEARERGVPEPRCMAKDKCGSPLSGDDFHEYVGPISDLSRWCFICGQSSAYALKAHDKVRLVGVCAEHLRTATRLRPINGNKEANFSVRKIDGLISVESLTAKTKKSLFEAIMEVESYYAEKEQKEEP